MPDWFTLLLLLHSTVLLQSAAAAAVKKHIICRGGRAEISSFHRWNISSMRQDAGGEFMWLQSVLFAERATFSYPLQISHTRLIVIIIIFTRIDSECDRRDYLQISCFDKHIRCCCCCCCWCFVGLYCYVWPLLLKIESSQSISHCCCLFCS